MPFMEKKIYFHNHSIKSLHAFNYISVFFCRMISKINAYVFFNLQKALDDLDFSGEEIHDILKIISTILKLGNINFLPTTNMDGTEGCAISNDYGK